MEAIYTELKETLKAQDPDKFGELTQKALDAGAEPFDLLNKIVGYAKELTSKSWWAGGTEGVSNVSESEALLLSDLIVIGECLVKSTSILKPLLLAGAKKAELPGKIVLGTIEGDVHDIGKSLVSTMYESAGYVINDIGLDVPAKNFAIEAKRSKADIVGISCSMSMCKTSMPKVVKELQKLGIRDNVKVVAGGQSTFETDVPTYGLDGWGADMVDAVKKTDELMRVLKEERLKKGVK
ncbi:MAG: cobalamin-dependent protein [Candidatus Bathyarchaeia archaeon]